MSDIGGEPGRAPIQENRSLSFISRRAHEDITETAYGDKHTIRDSEVNETKVEVGRAGDKWDVLALPEKTIVDNAVERLKSG